MAPRTGRRKKEEGRRKKEEGRREKGDFCACDGTMAATAGVHSS
jgi:hypothetical protein